MPRRATTANSRTPKFAVGRRVRFPFLGRQHRAVVVEDRGDIGYRGRHMVLIRPIGDGVVTDPGNTVEWPADELTLVR